MHPSCLARQRNVYLTGCCTMRWVNFPSKRLLETRSCHDFYVKNVTRPTIKTIQGTGLEEAAPASNIALSTVALICTWRSSSSSCSQSFDQSLSTCAQAPSIRHYHFNILRSILRSCTSSRSLIGPGYARNLDEVTVTLQHRCCHTPVPKRRRCKDMPITIPMAACTRSAIKEREMTRPTSRPILTLGSGTESGR